MGVLFPLLRAVVWGDGFRDDRGRSGAGGRSGVGGDPLRNTGLPRRSSRPVPHSTARQLKGASTDKLQLLSSARRGFTKSTILLRHSGLGLIGVAVAFAATSTGGGIAIGHGAEALPIAPFAAVPIALGACPP